MSEQQTAQATPVSQPAIPTRRVAMVGNPNTGKTTLFNRLCGIRAKTANIPGSTVEAHFGSFTHNDRSVELVDLPGNYGLNLDRPESRICREYLRGDLDEARRPDGVIVVADATNLARNLMFVSQAVQQGLPAVVALNMTDIAQRRGLTVDVDHLATRIGCPVVAISARSGAGIDELVESLDSMTIADSSLPDPTDALGAAEWADDVVEHSMGGVDAIGERSDTVTDRLDATFTHPIVGVVAFIAVMTGLFYTIFTLASVPMDLIDVLFTNLGQWIGAILPAGLVHDFLVDGVVAGVAGTVVFLPQICLLFFLLTLLEDTGYLARAAFVMDRVLRRFGLPGQSFVPLLSAHACAIPAIMSTRLIPNHRDRLATIFVAPFMSCSARLPVYVLMIGLLFAGRPLLAGLAFAGCYMLGAVAAVISALIARRTILKGPAQPMVLELPSYKLPSLRNALFTTYDRSMVFLKQAGTVIVCICIVLWWLGEFPRSEPPAEATALRTQAAEIAPAQPSEAESLRTEADVLEARHAKANSFVGMIGRTIEPVMKPLGYDWQLSIGVLSSLLAREVFVSTMAVVVAGEEDGEDDSIRRQIEQAKRSDGSPIFDTPTSASLLIYYVLAMQCLPTLAVTKRETGSWKWAAAQLVYMTGLAYVLASITYFSLAGLGA